MKKFVATAIMAIFTLFGVSAQASFDSPDNQAYWGVRIGLDVNSPGNIKSGSIGLDVFNAGAGFHFGAVRNLPLVANLYIEPGAIFYYDTFGVGDKFYEDAYDTNINLSYRQFGLRIPVMVGYHVDFENFGIHLFMGPEFSLGLYGRLHGTAKANGVKLTESENCYQDGGLNRLNAAFRFGAALEVDKFYLSIGGAFGSNILNDWSADDNSSLSAKHQMFTLSLGYNFK